MKPFNITVNVFAIVLILMLAGCSSMKSVYIDTMRPAQVTFPTYVNTIVLVDRTKFDKQGVNILEGILTGELPGADRAALQDAMTALQDKLMMSPRFKIKTATESLTGNSLTAAFPEPLKWDVVQSLCDKYGADAVVAFEIFDSDFILTDGQRKTKKKIKDDKGEEREVEVNEFYAKGIGNITMGLRVYDPKAQTMVDQQRFTRTNTWESTGNSIRDAVAGLIVKTEANRYLSSLAAADYAFRIAPMPVKLTRAYYAKSRKLPELTHGGRQAEVNDWKNAVATWESALNGARGKEAGKLCYNLAIGYEVLGDLEAAKKWANKSYVDYGNKKAKAFAYQLDRRKSDEEEVDRQMK